MALSGNQAAEAQVYQADTTWAFRWVLRRLHLSICWESHQMWENVAVWVPQKAWTGTAGRRVMVILRKARKKRRGVNMLERAVRVGGALSGYRYAYSWCQMMSFFMCTTAVKWNIAGLYVPLAELHFILMKKDEKKRPLLPLERSSVRYDYRQHQKHQQHQPPTNN